ncbi:MAG: serine/threonine-protein phosphatase, partial [Clostridiaceae bacterium]|nr:serine/threonine-protein phosphatase [Clostridiaceae bacterium]
MLHYDSLMRQFNKAGKDLCGDHCLTFSFKDSYYFAIFDGVGSGVYANLAAIGNAGRWGRMIREGISI